MSDLTVRATLIRCERYTRAVSFDHVIGGGKQGRRHSEAERPRGLQVYDEIELGRLHNREVGRFLAFENLASINADLMIDRRYARSITDQAAYLDEQARLIDRRKCVTRGKCCELLALIDEERVSLDDKRASLLPGEGIESHADLVFGTCFCHEELYSLRTGCLLHSVNHTLGLWAVRVNDQSNDLSVRDHLEN